MKSEARKIDKLSGILKGKVVDRVEITSVDRYSSTHDIDCDNSEVTVVFTDGSKITAWNSEWGGLSFTKGK